MSTEKHVDETQRSQSSEATNGKKDQQSESSEAKELENTEESQLSIEDDVTKSVVIYFRTSRFMRKQGVLAVNYNHKTACLNRVELDWATTPTVPHTLFTLQVT